MKKTKTQVNIDSFPKEIRHLFRDANVFDSSCSSDASVYYIDTGYYVKTGSPHSLTDEAVLTNLFYERGLGVEAIAYVSADRDYLVTRSAVGEDLTHYLQNPEKLCELLASSLLRLHSQPVGDVPVSSRYRRYIDSANGSFDGGCYDESVLTDRYTVKSKEEAWAIMQASKKLLAADTLIHGDACLPNIIQNNGSFSAFIDFNMSGAGDKHIDLYWAIWSLWYNLKTDEYTDLFLDLYGRDKFDFELIRAVAALELVE